MDYRAQFSGLNEASVDERLPSLHGKDGIYRFKVDRHALLNTDNGLTFIAEVTVLAGNNPAVPEGFRTSVVLGGLRQSVAWKRTKALGRVKAHLSAVWSIPAEANQDWIGIMQMCGEHNKAEGATFIAQTRSYTYEDDKGKTREGVEFTHAMDPENPLLSRPDMQGFYQALKAAG